LTERDAIVSAKSKSQQTTSACDQGISKAGNAKARTTMIELDDFGYGTSPTVFSRQRDRCKTPITVSCS
jgi:hypothetical protein